MRLPRVRARFQIILNNTLSGTTGCHRRTSVIVVTITTLQLHDTTTAVPQPRRRRGERAARPRTAANPHSPARPLARARRPELDRRSLRHAARPSTSAPTTLSPDARPPAPMQQGGCCQPSSASRHSIGRGPPNGWPCWPSMQPNQVRPLLMVIHKGARDNKADPPPM